MSLFQRIKKIVGGTSQEVFGRWVSDQIFGTTNRGPVNTPPNHPRKAVFAGVLYSNLLNRTAMDNFFAVWDDPAFAEHRDRCELAGAEFIRDLRNGITEKRTGVVSISRGNSARTYPVPEYKTGWDPESLIVNSLNEAGRSVESVKHFFEFITQETLFERVGKKLGPAVKNAATKGIDAFTAIMKTINDTLEEKP